MSTGARSSGSVTLTKTENARGSGASGKRSASGDRTMTGGKGESGRMERICARSRRKRPKRRRSVPRRRRRVRVPGTQLTPRGHQSHPETTRGTTLGNETGCVIR